ncbi:hypothetical protein FHR24_003101 [Wenyingzhuangia heitensis]|uniref:Uncharacterized protein n=1 Tax=Wenyingzhuangia heitensis TaxID=1487859 RepID=A0ABX0UGE7_9FLAO|nr:hypothetical protein [Wenyingzhuangia heitensis]NIJ46611.1 hypothetical protein [Wenyingzhuangia heitensis]
MKDKIKVKHSELEKTIGIDIKPITSHYLKKGIEYSNVSINAKEKKFIEQQPYPSIYWAFCAVGALIGTENMEGTMDGKADAMRHCLWGACMAKFVGGHTARIMLDNHEYGREDLYDNYNNDIAVRIGLSGKINLWNECKEALKTGKLKYKKPVRKPSKKTKPKPKQKPEKDERLGTDNSVRGRRTSNKPEKPEKPSRPEKPEKPKKDDLLGPLG